MAIGDLDNMLISPQISCNFVFNSSSQKKGVLVPSPVEAEKVDCGRPAAAQSCYETVGCTWQKGPGTETAWVMEAVISDSQFQRCCVHVVFDVFFTYLDRQVVVLD